MFSSLSKSEIIIFVTFNLSSANAFNLVWSKIVSCGNGLIIQLQTGFYPHIDTRHNNCAMERGVICKHSYILCGAVHGCIVGLLFGSETVSITHEYSKDGGADFLSPETYRPNVFIIFSHDTVYNMFMYLLKHFINLYITVIILVVKFSNSSQLGRFHIYA